MGYTPICLNVRDDIAKHLRGLTNMSEFANGAMASALGLPGEVTRNRTSLRVIQVELSFGAATRLMNYQNATKLSRSTVLEKAIREKLKLPVSLHEVKIRRHISQQRTTHELFVCEEVFNAVNKAGLAHPSRHHNPVIEEALLAHLDREELV